ncbi:CsbD family protein [Streptomyces sp. NBC_01198]|uniref:CsbD family protein n=1 Tax=Streptomyces sp. NBC_01198 TaxID=2903769 RepID=UPI002E135474|nr:CsbD family protein [Streptomyces sp. NBC_01198]
MSDSDKTRAKTEQATGKIKETVGRAAGDEDLEAEGRGDQAKGDLRQAGEKVKDAVKRIHKD